MSGHQLYLVKDHPWPLDYHDEDTDWWNLHVKVALNCIEKNFIDHGLFAPRPIAVTCPDVPDRHWNHAMHLLTTNYSTKRTNWSTWHKNELPDSFVAASVFDSFPGGLKLGPPRLHGSTRWLGIDQCST